jgi:uncharacterized DUF497 family protein
LLTGGEHYTVRIDFDWDPVKAASNVVKHGVTFESAMSVFHDPLARSIVDEDHGSDEERWITLGETAAGNLLVVVHTWIDVESDHSIVRIISVRRATPNEARQYREDSM